MLENFRVAKFLMQEDQEDADRTDESDGKEEDWEKLSSLPGMMFSSGLPI